MNVVSRGVRNAFRNGIRTIAIVGMLGLSIGLSLAMLFAHQAIGQKITNVQKDIGNTITIAPAGIRGFDGGGNPLTANELRSLASAAHVTSIDESLSDRLSSDGTSLQSAIGAGSFGRRQFRIENGGGAPQVFGDGGPGSGATFKPPIPAVGTTNPLDSVLGARGGSVTLSSGAIFDGTKDALVALVGKSLADKNNLKAGSTFTAYGQTFTVSGIFDASNTFGNNQVIMPLPTVQRLSDQSGAITQAIAHIDSAVNLDGTTKTISSMLGSKADVSNDADVTKPTLTSLQHIQNVSLFSLIGAAGTAAVIILLTMVMIVRERRREIGVLKAIGASNIRVICQFTVEAITLTLLAAVIGSIIGSVAATPVTKLLANNSSSDTNTSLAPGGGSAMMRPGGFGGRLKENSVAQGVKNLKANVNASIVTYGLGSAILIAVIGSTAAAGLIAKVRPAEVMRAE